MTETEQNERSGIVTKSGRQTAELLEWYDRNRRILPWREDPTPYHVWLSEIMLQQTRVEAGKAYYLRFLEQLPDIASLAAAPEEVYLKLWEGLGYYSRVRNLHRAAVTIMEEYGGRMPDDAKELEKLPGIGPYSAAAIASIAFGKPAVALDGNLLRVYARMTECGEDIKGPAARKAALTYYAERIPAEGGRPGDFNQALMDLGAGICLPNGEPLCGLCPWKERCLSSREGRQQEFPVLPVKKERKKEKRTVLILRAEGHIAIRRRAGKGLLAGLYEFPNLEGHPREEEIPELVQQLFPGKEEVCGADAAAAQDRRAVTVHPLPEAKHIFSHLEWEMKGYEVRLPRMRQAAGILWVTGEELAERFPIPSAFEAYRTCAVRAAEEGR